MERGPFLWRAWRGEPPPAVDLDGKAFPMHASLDIGSSTESLKMARHADERSSGKSNKSTGSGYLTKSCIKHDQADDSDASAGRPARPPKPARLSPARAPLAPPPGVPICEYVDVEPKPPERRLKPLDACTPPRPEPEISYRCKEYELMTDFMSHARFTNDETPPAVPPRGQTAGRARAQPRLHDPEPVERTPDFAPVVDRPAEPVSCGRVSPVVDHPSHPNSNLDTISNNDSLLDELQRDAYCVLKVCEDEPPLTESADIKSDYDEPDKKEKEDYGLFSRVSVQRKSNPIKSPSVSTKPLKTSSSTSNVHEAGSTSSRPLAERLTFFLKKKTKAAEESLVGGRPSRKEEKPVGRATPRLGQARAFGRGQSLELAPPEVHGRRIERSATTVNIPSRPINSSIVANLNFLSLHRYGAQEEQC